MFNVVRALLIMRGYDRESVKTHQTVLRLFSLEFVRTGAVDPAAGRSLRLAEKTRYLADYDESHVERDQAADVIDGLETFMRAAHAQLEQELSTKGAGHE